MREVAGIPILWKIPSVMYLCLISHCCVISFYSVRFLWLADITYLDLLKTSSSLEYLFLLNVYAVASFSEYSDLYLVKLLKFTQEAN